LAASFGKRLFVRNIAASVDSFDLEDLFNSVSDVEKIEMDPSLTAPNGNRAGYVYMQSEQGAKDCIERFNGFEKSGVRLIVTADAPHRPDPNFVSPKRRKAMAAKMKGAACSTTKSAAQT